MDPGSRVDPDHYRPLLERQVAGRRIVVFGGPLAGYTDEALQTLLDAGATSILVVATSEGTGDPPSLELAERIVIAVTATSIMGPFRAEEEILRAPPPELTDHLDRWDPDCTARLLGVVFFSVSELAGREVYGGRPPEHTALEDKVTVERLWEAAGIPVAPSVVVAADRRSLIDAHSRLDQGRGTVWSLDASRGWHGGGDGTRWLRTAKDLDEVIALVRERADRVRVMPFLEGLPCSVHGIVFPKGTAVFRPCELLTLRRPHRPELAYSGSATTWDPDPADREMMRQAARAVGEALRRAFDYRGGYTIDGVMTEDGFRPTELNARLGSAFGHLSQAAGSFPWGTISRALIEREPFDYRSDALEQTVVEAADAKRSIRGIAFSRVRRAQTERTHLQRDGDRYRLSDREDGRFAGVEIGPHPMGSMVRLSFEDGAVKVGEPAGPVVSAALSAIDLELSLGLGPLEAAHDVRGRPAG